MKYIAPLFMLGCFVLMFWWPGQGIEPSPDEGKGPGIAHRRANRRGHHVTAQQQREQRRDDEVKPDKWGE